MILGAQVFSAFCKRMSPIMYENILYAEDEDSGNENFHQKYIPNVLLDCYPFQDETETETAEIETAEISKQYGTFIENNSS